jgi:hypothetical protein
LEAPVEMRMPLRGALEELRDTEQDQRQCHPCERHEVLLAPPACGLPFDYVRQHVRAILQ